MRGLSACPHAVDGDHHFPDLLVGFQVSVRIRNLRKREGAVDFRVQLALRQMFSDKSLRFGPQNPVVHKFVPGVAPDSETFLERGE